MSQTLFVLSPDPLIKWPYLLIASDKTQLLFPSNVFKNFPDPMSHTLNIQSFEPLISKPSLLIANDKT